jgi:hypothetical protein
VQLYLTVYLSCLIQTAGPDLSCWSVCRCSTPQLTRAERRETESFLRSFIAANKAEGKEHISSSGPINIGVYFHIITNTTGHGAISDSAIAAQVAVLNSAFAGHFTFSFLGTDRTVKDAWFVMGQQSQAEVQAKQALRKGSRQHLNVYTAETVNKFLGYAHMPTSECCVWQHASYARRCCCYLSKPSSLYQAAAAPLL